MNTALHQPSPQHRPGSRLLLIGPYLPKASCGFAGLLVVVGLLLAGCGTATTSSPTSGNASAKPARSFAGLVDIGSGRKLYLECQGTGTPTVVLVPGLVAAADTWSYVIDSSGNFKLSSSAVYPEVGRFTRVCSYDRPGTARENGDTFTTSTSVPQPTSPLIDVADLHALLTAAKVPGPYVLVGWSFGGPIVRIYASTYPHDVVGLVLEDTLNEFLQTAMTPAEFTVFLKLQQNDDEGRVVQWKDVERINTVTVFDQLRAAPPVPAMPVVVLSGDTFDPNAFRARLPDMPANYPEVFWRAQLAAQDSLARLFPGAIHISHTNSGHNIQNENPMLVINWIRDVVEKVRQHST
jgi:pimeloyl-ACP methyl ester carboxylesterase